VTTLGEARGEPICAGRGCSGTVPRQLSARLLRDTAKFGAKLLVFAVVRGYHRRPARKIKSAVGASMRSPCATFVLFFFADSAAMDGCVVSTRPAAIRVSLVGRPHPSRVIVSARRPLRGAGSLVAGGLDRTQRLRIPWRENALRALCGRGSSRSGWRTLGRSYTNEKLAKYALRRGKVGRWRAYDAAGWQSTRAGRSAVSSPPSYIFLASGPRRSFILWGSAHRSAVPGRMTAGKLSKFVLFAGSSRALGSWGS